VVCSAEALSDFREKFPVLRDSDFFTLNLHEGRF